MRQNITKKINPMDLIALEERGINDMYGLKIKDTYYKGIRFRSRLEAKWAVFFDACGVEWEYEPEGYDLGDGISYLPDFKLHGVVGRGAGDLFVEVKGMMNDHAAYKLNKFIKIGKHNKDKNGKFGPALLIVGYMPIGETIFEIDDYIEHQAYKREPYFKPNWPRLYSFESIDGIDYATHPGINKEGKFELFGNAPTACYELRSRDNEKTLEAYNKARQARFEFGDTPERKD